MDYLSQVQKGIDYIEAELDSDLSLLNIAREAGISLWHFQRIFKALTNETLKTYIRSRRLSNAFQKLILTDAKIIDIALAAGFESQESFTRAFKKVFAITPATARKLQQRNPFLNKVVFNKDYLTHINGHVSLQPKIYQKKKMLLVGLQTRFYGFESDKNNIANKLPQLWDEFVPRFAEIDNRFTGVAYGIIQQTSDASGVLEYLAACEVSSIRQLPAGMVVLEIPETTYARFTHKGLPQNLNNTVNYIYSSWLMTSGKRHTYSCDIEVYGDLYRPNSKESLIHYEIPIA